jgi:hypothetical protein
MAGPYTASSRACRHTRLTRSRFFLLFLGIQHAMHKLVKIVVKEFNARMGVETER